MTTWIFQPYFPFHSKHTHTHSVPSCRQLAHYCFNIVTCRLSADAGLCVHFCIGTVPRIRQTQRLTNGEVNIPRQLSENSCSVMYTGRIWTLFYHHQYFCPQFPTVTNNDSLPTGGRSHSRTCLSCRVRISWKEKSLMVFLALSFVFSALWMGRKDWGSTFPLLTECTSKSP